MIMRSSGRSTLPTCRRSSMRAAITSSQRHVTHRPMSTRSTGRVHRSRRTIHKVAGPSQHNISIIKRLSSYPHIHFSIFSLQRSACLAGSPTPARLSSPWHGCRWPMSVPASSSLLRCPSTHSSYQISVCTARISGVS